MWFCSLIIYINTLTFCFSAVVQGNLFKALPNAAITGKSEYSGKAVSRVDCLRSCVELKDNKCSAAFFTQGQKCTLYNWNRATVVLSPGVIEPSVWIRPNILLFNVQHKDEANMTFAAAKDLCKQLGGTVTSLNHFYDANDAKYGLCRCGWVGDGSIRLINTDTGVNCPDATVKGVNSCYKKITRPVPDVYCTF